MMTESLPRRGIHRQHSVYAQRQIVFLVCAVAIMVGTPGLNNFDISGRVRDFGLINLTSVWRVFVLGTVGLVVGAAVLLSWIPRRNAASFNGLVPVWIYFLWLAIASLFARPGTTDLIVATYRLAEWGIALLVIQFLICGSPREAFTAFSRLMRVAPIAAILVIFGVWIYDPQLVYYRSADSGVFQIGHIALHANTLALVFGLGSLYWATTGRSRYRLAIACVLMLGCLLAWSRSGVAAAIGAILIYATARGLLHRRANALTTAAVIVVMAGLVLGGMVYLDALIQYALRGESLEYLQEGGGRQAVWLGALDLIRQSPFFGHGFIFGPKLLQNSPLIPAHFVAPQAHNDVINTMVAGGITGGVLLLAIYWRIFAVSWRALRIQPLFMATFAALFVTSMMDLSLSDFAGYRGIVLVALLRAVSMTLSRGREAGYSSARLDASDRASGLEFVPTGPNLRHLALTGSGSLESTKIPDTC